MFHLRCLAICSLSFGLSLTAWTPHAAAAELPVRGGAHPSFDRLVFDWTHPTPYEIRREGDRVTIDFSEPASVNLKPFVAAKLTRAREFSFLERDGHLLIRFSVDAKTVLKDFKNGAAIVIDITGANEPQEKKVESLPVRTEAFSTENTALKKLPEKTTSVTVEVAEAKGLKEPKTPAQPKEPGVPKEPRQPEGDSKNTVKENIVTPIPVAIAPSSAEKNAKTSVETTTNFAPPKTFTIKPPAAMKVVFQKPAAPLEIGATPEVVLSLDPKVETGLTAYERGGYAYLVFDRKLSMDFSSLTAGQSAPRVTIESLELPNNSGLRFAVSDGLNLRVKREGTVWKISLTRETFVGDEGITLLAQPDFALGARLLLSTSSPPEAVRLTDPVVGDELVALPLSQTTVYGKQYDYAELDILPSAQGVVLKPLVDKLIFRKVADGVEITTAQGLRLSSVTDRSVIENTLMKSKSVPLGKALFDLAGWQGRADETFTQTRQRLTQTIVDVPEAERNRARLDLARFYFAHGMGEEALGLLKFLSLETPDLKNYAEFQALMGAAKILHGQVEEGLADLNRPDIKSLLEVNLWQAAAEVQLRNWQDAQEKFTMTQNLLAHYPEPFYSKFSVFAVEAALAVGKDALAEEWFRRLDMGDYRPEIEPALNYLRGVMHSKAGRQEAAEKNWRKVIGSNDALYQIRAQLALIDLGIATKSITPAQAADRLEPLRFAWRGDDLEIDVLHRLGQFYMDARNYKAAISVLGQMARLYPNSPVAQQVNAEVFSAFRAAFLDGATRLTPLEGLSLYQAYGNLLPTGTERTQIVKALAEQLVDVDLLDPAADLLESLIRDSLQGEEKARAGTRLAAIRLLDRKADAAFSALAYGPHDNLPAELINERLLLRARALAEQHKEDEALLLLQNIDSRAAKVLRADINMGARRWPAAAKALLDLIGAPPKAGAAISTEQSEWLVNCAVALALAGDSAGLDKLAVDYGPVLAGMPQADIFRLLTQPEKSGQIKDLTAVQAKLSEVKMFHGFLDNYRKKPEAQDPADEKKTSGK